MKSFLVKIPVVGYLILLSFRFLLGFKVVSKTNLNFLKWLFRSRETTNFTYNISEANILYLTHFISFVSHKDIPEIKTYINEIRNDKRLEKHLLELRKNSSEKYKSDSEIRYGRRIGWYAIVRAVKPKVVIETGIDKGLGSCVIASALMKNSEEGFHGEYFGTDINPAAGYFFKAPYSNFGKILYGDSLKSLESLNADTIDIFINDSDHSAEYEQKEYELIKPKLTENAIILGDNSHCTTKLEEFAEKTERQFLFFREEPEDHWYPGAGIGAAF